MIAAMSLFAATTRASSGRSSTRGTTSAARMPRITMTTRISISVKPVAAANRTLPSRRACALHDARGRASGDYNPPVRTVALAAPPLPSAVVPWPAVRASRCPRVVVLLLVAGGATVFARWWLAQPLPLPVVAARLRRAAGATLKSVARDLAAANVLSSDWPLVALARIAWRRPDDQGRQLRDRRRA